MTIINKLTNKRMLLSLQRQISSWLRFSLYLFNQLLKSLNCQLCNQPPALKKVSSIPNCLIKEGSINMLLLMNERRQGKEKRWKRNAKKRKRQRHKMHQPIHVLLRPQTQSIKRGYFLFASTLLWKRNCRKWKWFRYFSCEVL